MNKKILCILILLISFVSISFAEENNLRDKYGNIAVGFAFNGTEVGAITGLTYQQWYENDFGFQVTVGAISTEYDFFYSADVQLQKLICVNDFGKKSLSSFFVWANAGVSSTDLRGDEGYHYELDRSQIKPVINLGAGFGMELILAKRISIPVKFGYMGHILNNPGFGPTLGAGILYRF